MSKGTDECFTAGDFMLEEIRALAASGAHPLTNVADQIQRKTRIGSEVIKYIAKTKIAA